MTYAAMQTTVLGVQESLTVQAFTTQALPVLTGGGTLTDSVMDVAFGILGSETISLITAGLLYRKQRDQFFNVEGIESHTVRADRLMSPLGEATFGKPGHVDPTSDVHREYKIDVADADFLRMAVLILFGCGVIQENIFIPAIHQGLSHFYLRMPNLNSLLNDVAVAFPHALKPRLTFGMIAPLERAILYLLGEYPITFLSKPEKIHNQRPFPPVFAATVHDVLHLILSSGRTVEEQIQIRALIYAALRTFSMEKLVTTKIDKLLDKATEMSPVGSLSIQDKVDRKIEAIFKRLSNNLRRPFEGHFRQFLEHPLSPADLMLTGRI